MTHYSVKCFVSEIYVCYIWSDLSCVCVCVFFFIRLTHTFRVAWLTLNFLFRLFDLRQITILVDPSQNAAKLIIALPTLKLKNIFLIHLTEHTHKIIRKVTIKLVTN